MEYKKTNRIKTEKRLEVDRGEEEEGEMIEGDWEEQTSSYKISKSWGYNVQLGEYIQ